MWRIMSSDYLISTFLEMKMENDNENEERTQNGRIFFVGLLLMTVLLNSERLTLSCDDLLEGRRCSFLCSLLSLVKFH